MTIQRIKDLPRPGFLRPLRTVEDVQEYLVRLVESLQQEHADRRRDFDLLQLSNIGTAHTAGADRIYFWDESAEGFAGATVGSGLSLSDTTLAADESAIDHDGLLNFEENEHVALPNTIANVLSDHDKDAHDALGIDAADSDTVDSYHATDLNPALGCAFRVYRSGGDQAVANTTTVTVAWDTESYDLGSDFASGQFTAPANGYYFLAYGLRLQDLDDGKFARANLLAGGSSAFAFSNDCSSYDNAEVSLHSSDAPYLASGTTIDVQIYHNNGSTLYLDSTNDKYCWFYGYRIA